MILDTTSYWEAITYCLNSSDEIILENSFPNEKIELVSTKGKFADSEDSFLYLFCFDALERAPDFIHQLLEEFGAGLGIEFIPAGGDVEADQEREDRVDGEDVEIDQFGRLVPAEPVEAFLALEEVRYGEDLDGTVHLREGLLDGLSGQMGYLSQAKLPVEIEPFRQENVPGLADVAVEMRLEMVSVQAEFQPVNQFAVLFRQQALHLGYHGFLIDRMLLEIEQQVGETGDDIGVIGHYLPKRIFLVAGRRYSPIRSVKSSPVKLSW